MKNRLSTQLQFPRSYRFTSPVLRATRDFATVSALIALAVSCAGGPEPEEFSSDANPSQEIANLENDIKDAETKQVDVLAPDNFSEAREALADAKDATKDNSSGKEILELTAEGKAYLSRAIERADVARDNISEIIEARQRAMEAGANDHFTDELRKADNDLMDVTSDIEDNDMGSFGRKRPALLQSYQDLELKSIKETKLGAAVAAIRQAKLEGAERLAPQTLSKAEKALVDTEAYITANRTQTAEITRRADEAVAAAQHSLKITQNAKGLKEGTPEAIALQMEQKEKETQSASEALDKSQDRLAAEQKKADALAADVAFTEKLQQLQMGFNQSEADVFQQGESILIRLKILQFPTGQAVLTSANFGVLKKVQEAAKEFPGSKIIVEGHTDDRGSAATNDRLSAERAEAVANYLASTGNINRGDIQVVGHGFRKPIASNKTEAGRAQNRRVDVVITPPRSTANM